MDNLIDTFANRLTYALAIRNMKPIELSEKTKIDKSKISSYMSGRYKAKTDGLKTIADVLNVSPVWLMGYDVPMEKEKNRPDFSSLSPEERKIAEGTYNVMHTASVLENKETNFYLCPVYGKISAGLPNWAEECLDGYLPIDPNLMNISNPEEFFFLRVDGESMNKILKNGSYALIRKTDFVEDGEIAVVLVNGYDATIKKFTKQGDFIALEPMSDDSSIKTQIYTKDTSIKVIGKYIGKMEINER